MKPQVASQKEFRVVPAGLFKATCLQLMDEVYVNRNLTIIITKRGKPLAQMTAAPEGIRIAGPTVHPDECAVAQASSLSLEASTALEEHRKKKKKDKKKRR